MTIISAAWFDWRLPGGVKGDIPVIIWAEVNTTAISGVVSPIVKAGAICVGSDGAGTETYPLSVVALVSPPRNVQ